MKVNLKKNFAQMMLIIECAIVFIIFQILTKGTFLTPRNLTNLMLQGCVYSIMGIGILFIMVSGNMDLSGGSFVGMLAALGGIMQQNGKSAGLTMLVMLALGLVVGIWQGYWIAYQKLPSFIVTLAGQLMFRGIALLVGGGGTVGPANDSFKVLGADFMPQINESNILSLVVLAIVAVVAILAMFKSRKNKMKYNLPVESKGALTAKIVILLIALGVAAWIFYSYRGIPYALLLLGLLAVIFSFVAKNTTFGRYVFAIGGNSEATRLAGVNTKRIIFYVYILMGFLIAVASIVYLGRVGSATANAGKDFEFSAITGCIVGGVSTMGGIGNIPFAILGNMFMQSLDNGMSLLNLGAMWQYIVRGGVMLLAVAVDVISKRNEK